MTYIISLIVIAAFFIYELDLVHIKKNRQLSKAVFPLTKEKYYNLTEEENKYLYKQFITKYKNTFKNNMLLCINKKADISESNFYGLDKTNIERQSLDDIDVLTNIKNINSLHNGIIPKFTGIRTTRSIKILFSIIIFCLIVMIVSLLF